MKVKPHPSVGGVERFYHFAESPWDFMPVGPILSDSRNKNSDNHNHKKTQLITRMLPEWFSMARVVLLQSQGGIREDNALAYD